tara:strand:+ start:91 stop:876 length:786 start_codon:yes stop_codon:yes gene_type:complete
MSQARQPKPVLRALLPRTVLATHPTLPDELGRCDCAHAEASDGTTRAVRWERLDPEGGGQLAPHAVLVMAATEVVERFKAGDALGEVVAQQDCPRVTLVATGTPPPGLERVLDEVQLECAISCRRALNDAELADMLAAIGSALAKAARPSDEQAFLAGLSSQDVLFNQKMPRNPSEAWLGALRQLLPERAAAAVHAAHPTVSRLYAHYRAAAATGAEPHAAIAELRVGNQRLGPCKSRRLHRVMMATREQADELMAPVAVE